ncbi:hypothetical protein [Aurantimicrobium minutum]|uniref:hypothetical protein n=1 Tax=Aurantimicrobium minutum TaxID=708131 RepID=UPI002475ADEC|nr:hypothetical protein [Aurantimicrobium minutum]
MSKDLTPDNEEIDVDDEMLETAAGGLVNYNLPNHPPTNTTYTYNETIYFS